MTQTSFTHLRLTLDPLIDPALIAAGGAALLLIAALLFWQSGRQAIWRVLAGAVLLTVLANPSVVKELRATTPDVALVIVDRSPSNSIADRTKTADEALAYLHEQLDNRPDLELRVHETQGSQTAPVTQTNLFDVYDQAPSDVPVNRRAGVILISDGQISDVPAALPAGHEPIHLLMTGRKSDHDLQIRLLKAPTYGLTGKDMTLSFRIDKAGSGGDDSANVSLRLPDGTVRSDVVTTNQPVEWTIPVPYPGQNVYEMTIPVAKDELTPLNNRAVFSIIGVRDRLRVLLVSGEPHAGGRTWRDLFKADNGVDLIHFTILRSPQERDMTPQHELSLIAFPIRQLFEIKLNEFDLIVLDRFRLNNILPDFYFQNIRNYVEQGGALLEVSGPSFGTQESLYNTALGSIFPTRPAGQVVRGPFKPELTEIGKIHPVTQTIAKNPNWGSWLQYVPVSLIKGDVLMTATNGQPLLILDHAGKGRIAQMASDQIWLWSRGYDGGGPTEELLRRTVHWLMKEPELEEDALDVRADTQSLTVRRRKLNDDGVTVDMTRPDGKQEQIELEQGEDGWLTSTLKVKDQGIYEFSSGTHQRMISYGDTNSPEMRNLIASSQPVDAAVKTTKGSVIRLEDHAHPDIRRLAADRDYGGRGWLGLRQNNSTIVTGTDQKPLLPPLFGLLLSCGLIAVAWWREGRRT